MSYTIDTSHASPNHSSRGGKTIGMIVLHATVGSYGSSLSWLCNPQPDAPDNRVSTHYLIRKDGHIAQLVPDERAAWHAGASFWHGMDRIEIQRRSLGVELENLNTGHDPYPPAQVAAAHWLCQQKIARYNIERADIVRHLDIAIPKHRKTDPAGLPWPLFADSLYLSTEPPAPVVIARYRVKAAVTGGATVRASAHKDGAVIRRLRAGEPFEGERIEGDMMVVPGFGSGKTWIRNASMQCVWANLLEEVR